MKALILAGGSGTRLWPVSRTEYPKQLLKIGEGPTLLQKTLLRYLQILSPSDIFIITNDRYLHAVRQQIEEIHPLFLNQVLVEPAAKNTAAAIAFAIKVLVEKREVEKEDTLFVAPSDHMISPEELFSSAVKKGESLVKEGRILTFGVCPTYPETGYGYIQGGNALREGAFLVNRFVEKPNLETAQSYLAEKNYYWNSGMFFFPIGMMLEELKCFNPEIATFLEAPFESCESLFHAIPSLSIDYAVLEKSKKTAVLPIDFSWSDIGSWDNVHEMLPKDSDQNVKIGNTIDLDTRNCLLLGTKRLIATIGLEDTLVIETPDVVLVAKKTKAQKVGEIVSLLRKKGCKEIQSHLTTHRPWGNYTILDEGTRYKIKKIVVFPGQTLSLQMHYHRSEHWVVVKGTAKVTVEEKETFVHENESIYVPKGATHRVANPGKVVLEIIETQVGEYLEEDDIIRFDDVYGRTS
jgi:mannose-1-phosphate guanylyltransferase/mannose-6-phosphate isomerase